MQRLQFELFSLSIHHLLLLQHECYSWSKRISWHWIFLAFLLCWRQRGTHKMEQVGITVCMEIFRHLNPFQGPWPAHPPNNYAYLKCISMSAVLSGFPVFVMLFQFCQHTYFIIFYHGQNRRMLKYKCVAGNWMSFRDSQPLELCFINP